MYFAWAAAEKKTTKLLLFFKETNEKSRANLLTMTFTWSSFKYRLAVFSQVMVVANGMFHNISFIYIYTYLFWGRHPRP